MSERSTGKMGWCVIAAIGVALALALILSSCDFVNPPSCGAQGDCPATSPDKATADPKVPESPEPVKQVGPIVVTGVVLTDGYEPGGSVLIAPSYDVWVRDQDGNVLAHLGEMAAPDGRAKFKVTLPRDAGTYLFTTPGGGYGVGPDGRPCKCEGPGPGYVVIFEVAVDNYTPSPLALEVDLMTHHRDQPERTP